MLQISVRRVSPLTDAEDEGVEGLYRVHFNADVSALTKEKQASIALDIFHTDIGISTLDDFAITVVEENGKAVAQDEDHEDYSESDSGAVEKVADEPMYIEGEDEGLSAEELDHKYNPDGGGEHPKFTREDWRDAVANDETILGYWDWLEEQIREEDGK